MKVFNAIIQFLDVANIKYEVIDHDPVLTCEDAVKIRGISPDQGAKALVCFADKRPVLIVLPCSVRLDFKLFKNWQKIKDLRFATPDEVKKITTLEVGSIPPIGQVLVGAIHELPLPTYVDEKLLEQEEICFNAGLHSRSIVMRSEDYVRVVNPTVGNFIKG